MKRVNKQQGFTIIELVVVILLLGILTATALPRFMDVTDEAHDAVVDGVLGGLNTATGLFRAQYFGKGQPAAGQVVPEFGLGTLVTNTSGYPVGTNVGTATLVTTADCVDVFNGLLQSGRPTMASIAASGAAMAVGDVVPANATADFLAKLDTGNNLCEYAYTGQFTDATAGDVDVLQYNPSTGEVINGATL